MLNEIQKNEAVKRMRALGLMPTCIKDFKENGKVWISEGMGILYDLSQREEILEEISNFQKQYNALVYHCIYTDTEFGTLVSFLYVSAEANEWFLDWQDIEYNSACCYVFNMTYPDCSEIGGIELKKINGGLVRVA